MGQFFDHILHTRAYVHSIIHASCSPLRHRRHICVDYLGHNLANYQWTIPIAQGPVPPRIRERREIKKYF
jgi:hypothetical protein